MNQSYNFTEPRRRQLITDVVILKENNVVTEQAYSVVITASTPADPHLNAATPEPDGGGNYDYSLGQPGQTFGVNDIGPDVQSITFTFFLNDDQFPEGVESFQATITPSEGFPTYRSPTTFFTSTLINIIDDDGKFPCVIVSTTCFQPTVSHFLTIFPGSVPTTVFTTPVTSLPTSEMIGIIANNFPCIRTLWYVATW